MWTKIISNLSRCIKFICFKIKILVDGSSFNQPTLYMIKNLSIIKTNNFNLNSSISSDLDLVDKNNQYKHIISLDDPCKSELKLGTNEEEKNDNEMKSKFNFLCSKKF